MFFSAKRQGYNPAFTFLSISLEIPFPCRRPFINMWEPKPAQCKNPPPPGCMRTGKIDAKSYSTFFESLFELISISQLQFFFLGKLRKIWIRAASAFPLIIAVAAIWRRQSPCKGFRKFWNYVKIRKGRWRMWSPRHPSKRSRVGQSAPKVAAFNLRALLPILWLVPF